MIDYSFDRPISPEQLKVLLGQTDWANYRDITGIQAMLKGTAVVLGVWEEVQLIGFARVISDGIYRALIDDVVIDASKRGQGIGSELMRKLLERLTAMKVEEIFLRCGDNVVPFYQRFGFEKTGVEVLDLS
ncbi:TPA: GNAT family N-acetyltransferase [Candidatus Poribacteria bacterium]|nr:GNAT family N-acetyltransferase [Candidatus Poribacteria bacterium]HIB85947.1 GNAT family N-acetyltransferase [Candidatus Poribacteria bacterium]